MSRGKGTMGGQVLGLSGKAAFGGALTILVLLAGTAVAQPMAAMKGMPLPGPELDPGTVSVRVVAGSPSSPVSGVDVTLTVNGTPRQARSDAEGRAFFKELAIGATVQAKIVGEDKNDVVSEEFQVPAQGGTKLMLSTRPPAGGMMGPMMGGEGAMPEPRKLSGQPRPEQNDPPGSYMVRLTYDDLKEKQPPVGIDVALVGYSADDKVSFDVKQSGPDGRVQFTGLDRTGATAYYALAVLPRGSGFDRLMSAPLTMVPQLGARVALSAEKRDSTAAAVDDLGNEGAEAGQVRITLEGMPVPSAEITIIDVATHAPIARQTTHPGPPDTTQIQGSAPFEAKADVPAGTVEFEVQGGPGTKSEPMAHVGLRLVPADATDPPADAPTTETDASGKAKLTAKPGSVRALVKINGREISTEEFDIKETGGVLHVEAHWPTDGPPEATIALGNAGKPGQVVYAEALVGTQAYRSRPFQLEDGRGARAMISIAPRVTFSFEMSSHIDDEFLAVQGRFDLYNNSWIPYVGNDGVLVPLPKGFKGAILADQDQTDVAVAQGEGYRVVRPLAPGLRRFVGAFSIPVEGGKIEWSLDLPFETWQAGIEIQQFPGMSVRAPRGSNGRTATDQRGTWYVLAPISIHAGHSMDMTITGLPSQPVWRIWVPRAVGLLVVGGLLAAIIIAIVLRRSAANLPRDRRRQQLLDELVALEQSGTDPARREVLVAELEKLWD